MGTAVGIRRVRPDDASAVRALRLEMLADTPLAYLTTLAEAAEQAHPEYVRRCVNASAGGQQAQYVAEVDRRFVAQVGGFVHPSNPDSTMLYAIYVTPSRRGTPVLADLIDAVATWSRDSGRPMLELEVVTTNHRARRAYEKLGFAPIGEPIRHPTIAVLTEQRMVRRA